MDERADEATREALIELVNNNINRKFFKEKRLEAFFEKCFTLQEPDKLMAEQEFYSFVYYDLKQVLQLVTGTGNLVNFTKFMVFFKVDEDPELIEILTEQICSKIKYFTVDELLTICANYSHTLSPQTKEIFRVVNEEFCIRLTHEHNPSSFELVFKPEDLMKITATMLEYEQMHDTLKNGVIDYIKDEMGNVTFETMSELAVIFAMKMDPTYKGMFFSHVVGKCMKELRHLKDETLYKIVWSLVKSQTVVVAAESVRWQTIKQNIKSRAKDLNPKVMADLLVLSTMEAVASEAENQKDLFSMVEGELMSKMKVMALEDLVNLMWTGLKIDRGSHLYYDRLERELAKRMRGIKDEQFETLLQCFIGDKGEHSLT